MKLILIFALCLLVIAVVADNKGKSKNRDRDDSSKSNSNSHHDSDSDERDDDDDDEVKWNKYKQKNKKGYKNPEEEVKRRNEFKKNDNKFKKHNERQKTGQTHFKMGHNRFSDRNDTDLERKFLHKFTRRDFSKVQNKVPASSYPIGPDSVSYRTSTLPVLNQEACGCCWAFSAVAQVEAQLKRKDPAYSTRISPQYLLDCQPNSGCETGGAVSDAFSFLKTNGLVDAAIYPYTAIEETCKANIPKLTQQVTSFTHYDLNGDENLLKNVLAAVGPVVVSMYVVPGTFMHYESGIYWDETCPNQCQKVNHAMLLVGYGTDTETYSEPLDYWLFKNSFGPSFGEAGYIRIIRNSPTYKNNCNIACMIDFSS